MPRRPSRRLAGLALLLALAGAVPAGAQGYAMPAPPPPPNEVMPPPPGPPAFMVWQPGFWRWNGRRYIWIRGHYARAPYVGAVWLPGHWVMRPRGWVWIRGHWR